MDEISKQPLQGSLKKRAASKEIKSRCGSTDFIGGELHFHFLRKKNKNKQKRRKKKLKNWHRRLSSVDNNTAFIVFTRLALAREESQCTQWATRPSHAANAGVDTEPWAAANTSVQQWIWLDVAEFKRRDKRLPLLCILRSNTFYGLFSFTTRGINVERLRGFIHLFHLNCTFSLTLRGLVVQISDFKNPILDLGTCL